MFRVLLDLRRFELGFRRQLRLYGFMVRAQLGLWCCCYVMRFVDGTLPGMDGQAASVVVAPTETVLVLDLNWPGSRALESRV